KIALFEGRELIEMYSFHSKFSTSELQKIFRKYPSIKHTIVSSVINHSKDISNFLSNHSNYLQLDDTTPVPLTNQYRSPETLGKDRLAGAVGAWALYKGDNVLVI